MTSVEKVVTVSEAARIANVTIWAIMHHIDAGHLVYRKTDRVYLVCLDSLLRIYEKTPSIPVQAAAQAC